MWMNSKVMGRIVSKAGDTPAVMVMAVLMLTLTDHLCISMSKLSITMTRSDATFVPLKSLWIRSWCTSMWKLITTPKKHTSTIALSVLRGLTTKRSTQFICIGIKILSASNAMPVTRHSFLSHSLQTTLKHCVLFPAVVIAISLSVLSVDRCLRLRIGTGSTLNISMWMLKIQNLSFVNCAFLRCGHLKVSKKHQEKCEGWRWNQTNGD